MEAAKTFSWSHRNKANAFPDELHQTLFLEESCHVTNLCFLCSVCGKNLSKLFAMSEGREGDRKGQSGSITHFPFSLTQILWNIIWKHNARGKISSRHFLIFWLCLKTCCGREWHSSQEDSADFLKKTICRVEVSEWKWPCKTLQTEAGYDPKLD